ncbi:sigma-70 family RNA polymerase sigma factor [Streptomyces sp. NPDC056161]|uniref:sigma-70 family RNA polymerase sigma factor n=1 Tax=Streptomyces sp. NPDC056161 TaxID=3345732 RepID=UPI0035DD0D43
MATKGVPPRWDRKMQQRLARGEAAALGELYDRYASLVHALAHRVLADDAAADGVTREVFVHVWEHPDSYDPRQGALRSWMAALTHRLAVRRLRATGSAALADDGAGAHTDEADEAGEAREALEALEAREAEELEGKVRHASVAARADYIVQSMPAPLRAALDLAYFQRRDYRQTAADLGVTEDEARRRLRLGLQLLSTAHDAGTPPGYGGSV